MSLAASANSKPSNADDAKFRVWGLMISTQLAAAGLVQTADSGQINWTTVTAPIAGSTAAGYEVWRFADALQATKPVFFKIEYGSGAAATTPALWITFGSGTDGSGTLTGTLSTRMSLPASGSYTTNDLTSYFSGDTNRFTMALWLAGTGAAATYALFVSIERSVDGAGTPTGEAVLFVAVNGGTGVKQVAWNTTTGPTTTVETSLGAMGPSVGTGSSGSQLSVYPVFHTKGAFFNSILNAFAYFQSDIPSPAAISFTVYGATHTYLPLGVPVSPTLPRAATAASLLMRYE
jgi:hypothetical protein